MMQLAQGHLNIIRFFHYDEPQAALCMEAATLGSFFDHAASDLPMPPPRLAYFIVQVVAGLHHLHDACKIAHLDLKLENFLLVGSPDTEPSLKITDFGFASTLLVPSSAQLKNGTPGYMAPELYSHVPGIGPGYDAKAVDAWALGVCVFVLATGRVPFSDPHQRPLTSLPAFIDLFRAQQAGSTRSVGQGARLAPLRERAPRGTTICGGDPLGGRPGSEWAALHAQ